MCKYIAHPGLTRVRQGTCERNTEEIDQLSWPAFSPDLNLIEHAWDALGRAVQKRSIRPTNLRELEDALLQEWGALSQRDLNKLMESVPRRTDAAIQARWRVYPILRVLVFHTQAVKVTRIIIYDGDISESFCCV